MTDTSVKIPCTVGILTKNSGATLEKALRSVVDCAEIIICDGGSTDSTLTIARAAGARIIPQDPVFLDADGRITDYSGVRNQTFEAATQPWFFFLDSDEYIATELVEAIRTVTATAQEGAYWVLRKYVVEGKVIDCATTYPNRSMRFFAKVSVEGFVKKVHERIKLKEGVVPKRMNASVMVPIELNLAKNRAKDANYISIDAKRLLQLDEPFPSILYRVIVSNLKTSTLYSLRLLKIALFCRGTHMPLEDELERHRYNFLLIREVWRRRKEHAVR